MSVPGQPGPHRAQLSGPAVEQSRDHYNVNNNIIHRSADRSATYSSVKYSRSQLLSMRSTNRSVLSSDVCELLRRLNLVRRRRGCRGGRRSTTRRRAGTSLYNIPVVVGPRTRCKRSYIEERPTALCSSCCTTFT